MYRAFVLLNVVLASLVVLVGLRIALSIASPFPTGFLFYYPIVLGLCGVIGLYRVAAGSSSPPGIRIRNDLVFLSAGILGVVSSIFVVAYYFPPMFALDIAAQWMWLPCSPVVIALVEIRRRVPAMSKSKRSLLSAASAALLILSAPVAMGIGRVVVKEAAIAWYGRHFPENAIESAVQIARGRPYRISVPGYPPDPTLHDLDRDVLLDRAFENHFKMGDPNGRIIEPHIRLYVGDERYLWSFRKGQFYSTLSGHLSRPALEPQ